ncbi:MAG: alpha-hydroxy-acid oxidizing protein [Proteobacteria bacterium]|nr:alpha-hydroxy-acid oxidizing protein [Pseudomonadota bacterium]
MTLSELYEKGRRIIGEKDLAFFLEAVETGFITEHDRRIIDRYTFRQRCIDGVEADPATEILGLELKTPVIMSAITMPIPAIVDDGLMAVAEGLKEAGSLMWTGTPVPMDLKGLKATGVALAATAKPFKDRARMFEALEKIQSGGADWVGLEIDVGQGTKIKDRPIVADCAPLTLKEIREVRRNVSGPFWLKGVLSRIDAEKAGEAGADGIVVSNHGAHTLDYLPHPFQVMDEIMEAARGRLAVVVDGGIRRGSDVVKALAFGASAAGLGRPILWALAAGGREGVRDLVREITEEARRIMSLVGASAPTRVPREALIQD